jgi:antitoxin component YwqK of YwqJK toxin-antitoxin module
MASMPRVVAPGSAMGRQFDGRAGDQSMTSRETEGTAHVVYYKDGSIWAKGRMDGKVPVGYWEYFRKDGTIMGSGTFEKGQKIGAWTRYDAKGEVEKVTTFRKKGK